LELPNQLDDPPLLDFDEVLLVFVSFGNGSSISVVFFQAFFVVRVVLFHAFDVEFVTALVAFFVVFVTEFVAFLTDPATSGAFHSGSHDESLFLVEDSNGPHDHPVVSA